MDGVVWPKRLASTRRARQETESTESTESTEKTETTGKHRTTRKQKTEREREREREIAHFSITHVSILNLWIGLLQRGPLPAWSRMAFI